MVGAPALRRNSGARGLCFTVDIMMIAALIADAAEEAPSTLEVLRDIVSIPIVVTLIGAGAAFAVPTVRWNRRLKQELEIANGLPQGSEERRFWEERSTAHAQELREYYTLVPFYDRLFGWLTVVTMGFAIFSAVVWGIRLEGPPDYVFVFGFGILGLIAAINTLRGRTFYGFRPKEYPSHVASERRLYQKAEARRRAGRRLRRMKRRGIAVFE